MQRFGRALSVLAVALAAIAGGDSDALAAAPWSEPQSISGGFERIGFNADGQGMLFGLGQVLPGDGHLGRVLATSVQGRTPDQTRVSTTPLNLGRITAYGRDGFVAGGDLTPGYSHVALLRGRFGHPVRRPQPLRGRSRSSHLLDLAVNDARDAVAAVRWSQTRGCGRLVRR